MVTGQAVVNMSAEAAVCPLQMEPPNTMIFILTYADGDVCGPLVVVLAGDCSLAYQLKAKLTLKPQDSSIWEVLPFSNAIERSPRVSTTLFVYFWKEKVCVCVWGGELNWMISDFQQLNQLEISRNLIPNLIFKCLFKTKPQDLHQKKWTLQTFPAVH